MASLLCYRYANRLLDWLVRPPLHHLIFTSPIEPFVLTLKLSAILGFVLSFPWLFYQAWRFASLALRPIEKKALLFVIPCSYFLFLGGVAAGVFVVAPVSLKFLLSFGSEKLVPYLSVTSYLGYLMCLSLGLGLFFQMPVALYFASSAGIVSGKTLRRYRRHALLGFLILSAVLTPDVMTASLMAAAAYVLFEVTLLALIRG